MDGQPIADALRDFFGPIFLTLTAVAAGVLLFSRETTRFVSVLVLGIAVALLMYQPGVIKGVGAFLAGLLPTG